MKKTKTQLKNERDSIKQEVLDKLVHLCEIWASRSMYPCSSPEAKNMLFPWFAYAVGGRLIKHNELLEGALSDLLADKLIKRGNLLEKEIFDQCQALTCVWGSWIFMTQRSWNEGDARSFWFFHTGKLHPSISGGANDLPTTNA